LHFGDRQTNRQTNEQMDSTEALSRSRCCERQLNNPESLKCTSYYKNQLLSYNTHLIHHIKGSNNENCLGVITLWALKKYRTKLGCTVIQRLCQFLQSLLTDKYELISDEALAFTCTGVPAT